MIKDNSNWPGNDDKNLYVFSTAEYLFIWIYTFTPPSPFLSILLISRDLLFSRIKDMSPQILSTLYLGSLRTYKFFSTVSFLIKDFSTPPNRVWTSLLKVNFSLLAFLFYQISSIVYNGLLKYRDISSTFDYLLSTVLSPPYVRLLDDLLSKTYGLSDGDGLQSSFITGGLFYLFEFFAHNLTNKGIFVLFY